MRVALYKKALRTLSVAYAAGVGAPAFAVSTYTITDLGSLGGGRSEAIGLNDVGQVVGTSATAAGERHAFLYQNGAMQDLGTLGGSASEAFAINERGQVVGGSYLAGDTAYHAFLYSDGVMRSYLRPASRSFEARDINNAGDAVGLSYEEIAGRLGNYALLFRGDQAIDLGGLADSGNLAGSG